MKTSELSPENRRKWAEVIARCWKDKKFKERLFKSPKEVLTECGLTYPSDVHCKIIDVKENEMYLLVPPAPKEKLTDAELKNIAAAQNVPLQYSNTNCSS